MVVTKEKPKQILRVALVFWICLTVCVCPKMCLAGSVAISGSVCDCTTRVDIGDAKVYFEFYMPGKLELTIKKIATDTTGSFIYGFTDSLLEHRIYYMIVDNRYVTLRSQFILENSTRLDTCLTKTGEQKKVEGYGILIDGIVRNNQGDPLIEATIGAKIDDKIQLSPLKMTDSTGEFSWVFESRFLGRKLNWKISKDGYLDSRGAFLIDKDKTLDVTLAPIIFPEIKTPNKKGNLVEDYIVPLGALGAWTIALIRTAF